MFVWPMEEGRSVPETDPNVAIDNLWRSLQKLHNLYLNQFYLETLYPVSAMGINLFWCICSNLEPLNRHCFRIKKQMYAYVFRIEKSQNELKVWILLIITTWSCTMTHYKLQTCLMSLSVSPKEFDLVGLIGEHASDFWLPLQSCFKLLTLNPMNQGPVGSNKVTKHRLTQNALFSINQSTINQPCAQTHEHPISQWQSN